jgi:AbrB family looped-hinge helix DNA binding protein
MGTPLKEKVRLGAKRQLTLPQEATSKLGLREGDVLELRIVDDKIELVPMALIPRDQLWYWTPEWQTKEKEADRDIASGRVKRFKSVAKAIKALKS